VKALNNTTLPAPDRKAMVKFQRDVAEMTRIMTGTADFNEELLEKVAYLKQAIVNTPAANTELLAEAEKIEKQLQDILFRFEGSAAKASDEEIPPRQVALGNRLQYILWGQSGSTSAITSTSKMAYQIIQEELPELIEQLKTIATVDIKNLEGKLDEAKAPWTPGRIPVMN
jgi:septal ring factor EnvC (AmiA/AmiB activator)